MNFVPYNDQENSQLAVLGRGSISSIGNGPVGKTFQSQKSQQASSLQPRQALGDVKNIHSGLSLASNGNKGGKLQKSGHTEMKKPAFRLQPTQHNSMKPTEQKQISQKEQPSMLPPSVKVITKKSKLSAEVEDRENMYILEEEDHFDDIWPSAQRPSAQLKKWRKWRPSHLLGCVRPQVDKEDDLVRRDLGSESICRLVNDSIFDDDLRFDSGIPLEHIPLPSLESLGLDLDIVDLDTYGDL